MSIIGQGPDGAARAMASAAGRFASSSRQHAVQDEPASIDPVSFSHTEFLGARTLDNALHRFYRDGGFGIVGSTGIAAAVAILGPVPTAWVILITLFTFLMVGGSMASIPAYRRATARRPAMWMLAFVATIALVSELSNVQLSPATTSGLGALTTAGVFSWVTARLYRHLNHRVRTMIVGACSSVDHLAERWEGAHDVDLVAACSWNASETDSADEWVLRDVPRVVRQSGAERVVIVGDHALSDPMLRHLAWGLQRADLECLVYTEMNDYAEYVQPKRVGGQLVLAFEGPRMRAWGELRKEIFDRFVALSALLLLSPFLVLIAIAIKFESKGPVMFSQRRAGKDGIPFTMYKLRSMHVGADARKDDLLGHNEGSGPLFKMVDDPRVTKVGRWIRRTSIDELPQLFNVLLGDMSLVGPRPALEREAAAYSPWVWRRLHVKPGLTGLWQVSGRSDLSWEESIRLDLEYVNTRSSWLDIKILLATIRVVLTHEGAH